MQNFAIQKYLEKFMTVNKEQNIKEAFLYNLIHIILNLGLFTLKINFFIFILLNIVISICD